MPSLASHSIGCRTIAQNPVFDLETSDRKQATTRSSDHADNILDSIFRRIPSPKYLMALLYNVLGLHSRAGRRSLGPWIALIVVVASSSFSSS
jgi:hypothetical protein